MFDWCFLFLIRDTSESPIFCGFGRMEMCCGRQQHIMQQWNVCTGLKKAIACRYVCGADFEQSRVWSSYVVSVELLSFCFVESIIIPSALVLTPVKQLCFGGNFESGSIRWCFFLWRSNSKILPITSTGTSNAGHCPHFWHVWSVRTWCWRPRQRKSKNHSAGCAAAALCALQWG